jgi:hypothetical protein
LGGSRVWNFEITADLARKEVVDLTMARNGRHLSSQRIGIHGVVPAFAYADASVCLEMSNQITALHSIASTSGSRMTFFLPIDFFERLRFA